MTVEDADTNIWEKDSKCYDAVLDPQCLTVWTLASSATSLFLCVPLTVLFYVNDST